MMYPAVAAILCTLMVVSVVDVSFAKDRSTLRGGGGGTRTTQERRRRLMLPSVMTVSDETQRNLQELPAYCSCDACTSAWSSMATDDAGTFSCGSRMRWVEANVDDVGGDLEAACLFVAGEFPSVCPSASLCDASVCSPSSDIATPDTSTLRCGCSSCTDAVWEAIAEGYSCGNRIEWVSLRLPSLSFPPSLARTLPCPVF